MLSPDFPPVSVACGAMAFMALVFWALAFWLDGFGTRALPPSRDDDGMGTLATRPRRRRAAAGSASPTRRRGRGDAARRGREGRGAAARQPPAQDVPAHGHERARGRRGRGRLVPRARWRDARAARRQRPGKTTTLSSHAACDPSGGDAHVCGASVRTRFGDAAARLGVVTQQNALWDGLTCAEHLRCFALLRGARPRARPTSRRASCSARSG